MNNIRELVSSNLAYVQIYSARTRLFESSVFEVVKSEPPPSVLDGVFFFLIG